MNSQKPASVKKQNMFKQASLGEPVVLNENFVLENHKALQMEAIALKTMENAELEAQRIVQDAQRQAQEILAAAQERAGRIEEEERNAMLQKGYEEGFQAGLQEGFTQIVQESADKLITAEQVLEKAYQAERQILQKRQLQLANMLDLILKRVLRQELQTRPQHLVDMIEAAAERIESTGTAKILMNPETLKALKEVCPEMQDLFHNLHRIILQPDMTCSPTDLILENVECSFDISPERQAEIYLTTIAPQAQALLEAPAEEPEPLPAIADSPLIQAEEVPVAEVVDALPLAPMLAETGEETEDA